MPNMVPVRSVPMAEQWAALMRWAQGEARRTGMRQRVVSLRTAEGGWAYWADATYLPSRHRRKATR